MSHRNVIADMLRSSRLSFNIFSRVVRLHFGRLVGNKMKKIVLCFPVADSIFPTPHGYGGFKKCPETVTLHWPCAKT